jgi:hypothetical protein
LDAFALHHASADNVSPRRAKSIRFVNEGIRFSAIVAYLEKLKQDQPQQRACDRSKFSRHVNGTDAVLGHFGASGA